jgi:endonuclease-3
MTNRRVRRVLDRVAARVARWREPAVTRVARRRDPYRVLVSCLLSLRTKDDVTDEASRRLFRLADTPRKMVRLAPRTIEKEIFPVGFYKRKARTILDLSRELLEKHGGKVPAEIDELLRFKGVGRKTANLVRTLGFGLPGICVDTHVHRITNRWGYVATRSPDETEQVLRAKLPEEYWIPINDWLVSFGQNLCKPISPICSECPVERLCGKVGVTRRR